MSQLHSAGNSGILCPAGVVSPCAATLVGVVVLCGHGEVVGYGGISPYCLSCHSETRPMPFAHPTEVEYPATREGYRDRNALHSSIQLNAGFLTCRSCHAGSDPKKHFLLEHSGLANICGYCHVTGIRCPGEPGDLKSECYPGRLKGGVRCAWGETVELFEHTSGFCVNCHGSLQAMSAFHKVEIDYPSHRKGFKPLAELDDEIKLEDGRVTCESCHLKIDEGFAVCSECHPK